MFSKRAVNAHSAMLGHIMNCREFPHFGYVSHTNKSYDAQLTSGLSYLNAVSGGNSFEYWEWISNMYIYRYFRFKNFGELVDYFCINTPEFKLPLPVSGSSVNPALSLINSVAIAGSLVTDNNMQSFGPFSSSNAIFTVQHAGCLVKI
jgi:hypothetical protein